MEIDKLLGENFGAFHVLVCVAGIFGTMLLGLISISGVYANLLHLNCSDTNASRHLPAAAQGQVSSLSVQYELCDPAVGELTSILLFVGMAIGSIIVGPTSDLVGRVPTMAIGALVTSAACLLGNYCPQFWLHLASRCACGCAVMMVQCSVQVYGNEMHTQRHRGKFNSAWTVGMATAGSMSAAVAFFSKQHQVYMLFACGIGLLTLAGACALPESPIWLLERGHFDRAVRSFGRIACVNRRPAPSAESVRRLLAEMGGGDKGTPGQSLLQSLKQLQPRQRLHLAVLVSYGFSACLSNYGFYFTVSRAVNSVYVYIAIASLLLLPAAAVMNLGQRQRTLWLCGLCSGLLCLAVAGLTFAWPQMEGTAGWAAIGFGLGGSFFASCSYVSSITAGAELFPTRVRNTCMGLYYLVSRFGAMASPALAFIPSAPLRLLLLALPPLVTCWPILVLPDTRKLLLHTTATKEVAVEGAEAGSDLLAKREPIHTTGTEKSIDA